MRIFRLKIEFFYGRNPFFSVARRGISFDGYSFVTAELVVFSREVIFHRYVVAMDYSKEFFDFIREHASDDASRLLLSAARYPGIDVLFAVDQIEARRRIREKLPSWYREPRLLFPSRIAAEQCSSERTASYKRELVGQVSCLCDLTGGLGVDSYFFSLSARRVIYIERFPEYREVAEHNFGLLGATNIETLSGDAADWVERLEDVDLFYVDPARRGEGDRRVFALSDCEPDLPRLLPLLFRHAPRVLAKLSPMADIAMTLELLPRTVAVHVLSVRNECKELLFDMEREAEATSPQVCCVNFASDGREERFCFSLAEERTMAGVVRSVVRDYLYEPNASILKAGAFKSVGARYGLDKLHVSSHLYTSDNWSEDFPGRSFRVEEVIPFNGKSLKGLVKRIPRANVTARNFPLSVAELRKRTGIREGGDVYLFATTLAGEEKVLIRCRKLVR